MRIRSLLVNGAVATAALAIGLLAAEALARVILNPADYLSVELQPDEILGAVPSRSTAGGAFDRWGFRNAAVPESADIVAIGDSHTYGNAATMSQAWPSVLARLTGQKVYNMGLGGYGPNQYFHLLPKALELRPKLVTVGLYLGDDFENAFLISYGLKHWAALRRLPAEQVDFDIWSSSNGAAERASFAKPLRVWLSRHSVVYQLVFHGPLLGALQGEAQIRNAAWLSDAATTLTLPEHGVLEAFRPRGLLRNLEQDSPNVAEGMRISFELLSRMKALCDERGVRMLVVVIPTKESVFADLLAKQPDLPLADVIARLVAHEERARAVTFAQLRSAGIDVVDALPALREARSSKLYARTAADMHPNGAGYAVIAQAVAAKLAQESSGTEGETSVHAVPPTAQAPRP